MSLVVASMAAITIWMSKNFSWPSCYSGKCEANKMCFYEKYNFLGSYMVEYLLVQSQRWKNQRNEWNLFKINRTEWHTPERCHWCHCGCSTVIIIKFEQNLAHCPGVYIVDFEDVDSGWEWVINDENISTIISFWQIYQYV